MSLTLETYVLGTNVLDMLWLECKVNVIV